jgi:rhodanese-related sulfurtransferase
VSLRFGFKKDNFFIIRLAELLDNSESVKFRSKCKNYLFKVRAMTQTIINIGLFVLLIWLIVNRILPPRGVRIISTAELKQELGKKDVQYIDVRTPMEFRANHIRGFKNIPLHELQKRAYELSQEKEVIVICQSGMRSAKASKLLKKLGFKRVTNVKGGMNAWS